MNWVIKSTKKLGRHTDLTNLLVKEWIDISQYNWFLSDLDVINFDDYNGKIIPIDFRDEYQTPSKSVFESIVNSDLQIIWGVISAVKNESLIFDPKDLPYVEGNEGIWENNYFQITNATLEITAWDSSYTIVKFKDEELSKKFKNYFTEAIELEKFKF